MVIRKVILLMHGTECKLTEAKNFRWKGIKFNKGKNLSEIYFHGKTKKEQLRCQIESMGNLWISWSSNKDMEVSEDSM